MIDRQDAINAIVNELDAIDHVPQWVFDRLTKCLEKVPSAEEPHETCNKWLLFSEKVPPAWEKVLITVKDYDDHNNECGRHVELTYDKGLYKDYVAWMPLPKTYSK